MENLKPIKQLPELKDNQEWACEGGCGDIQPVLHRNVYCERWDLSGRKIEEKAEHYYTCQNEHTLAVWDEKLCDYVSLPEQAYQSREVPKHLNLKNVSALLDELQAEKRKMLYGMNEDTKKYFQHSTISYEIHFKNGNVINMDEHYLNELKAILTEQVSSHG